MALIGERNSVSLDSADILVTQIPGELKIVQGLQPSKLAHGFSIYLHPSHANRSGVELSLEDNINNMNSVVRYFFLSGV